MFRLLKCKKFIIISTICLGGCLESESEKAIGLCKKAIEKQLKSPASAQYLGVEAKRDSFSLDQGNLYAVSGQVDAANSYGVLLRDDFACVADLTIRESPQAQAFLGYNSDIEQMETSQKLREKYHKDNQLKIRRLKQRTVGRKPPDVVSYLEFLRLHKGMTLNEVQKIIGHDGVEISEAVRTLHGGQRGTFSYRWENYDGSSVFISFDNGKVVYLDDHELW